ncbi:uncharacterized protein [Nicotiana tomentosiformis]|uniref:uncharacterized protein n=1 Tax=Nicotiana tomentosiformis TaxID=4098 RepID=UPI00388C497A
MTPPSGDEEVLPSSPKQVKEKKRKGAPSSPGSENKKSVRKSRKPKGDTGVMPSDLIRRLRDEPEEGEEEDNSKLVTLVRANVLIQKSSELAEVDEGALAEVPEPERVEATPSQDEMVKRDIGGEASRAAEDIPRDELGLMDISGSPQVLDAMIREANMLEGCSYGGLQGATAIHGFLDGFESASSENVTGFSLSIPKKAPPSGVIGSSSSPKLVDLFPAHSVNPDRRQNIVLYVPEDAQASVLHHEAFHQFREEHKAEVRDLTKKNDTYKLLSEKLQADLVTARDEHAEMAEQAEAEEFKKNIDILASKKEVVQAQLESTETQLQVAKEKTSVQVEKIKELQSQFDLAISDKANLANELEVARSEVTVANTKANANVAQFRVDVEAI